MSAAGQLAASVQALQGVAVIEQDVAGDCLPVWCYPALLLDAAGGNPAKTQPGDTSRPSGAIPPELATAANCVLMARSGLQALSGKSSGEKSSSTLTRQSFHRWRGVWTYTHIELCLAGDVAGDGENSNGDTQEKKQPAQNQGTLASDGRVVAFQICVLAKDFHPEKYAHMAKALARAYTLSGGDPLTLLDCYLQIFSRGRVKDPQSADSMLFDLGAFSDPRAPLLATPVSALAKLLGENFVLLWTAMILKKRVVIFSERLAFLLRLIRAVPLVVFHRNNWNVLRPYVAIEEPNDEGFEAEPGAALTWHDVDLANRAQMADLKEAGHYVAGFTNGALVREREQLYDLLIDLDNRTATVASHAAGDFKMTALHKGVHDAVTAAVAADAPDTDVVKALALKTRDILTKLESLKRTGDGGGAGFVDAEAIAAAGVSNANLAHFLYGVALAESMTRK